MIYEVLGNGVQVVLKENRFAPAVAVQAWIGVGSLDELPNERGMAHFLEHMLFKGTEQRGVGEIAATVEACGGEINAYTTFDHTVYHLTLASPHAGLGVELLFDAVSNSRIDTTEFEREREVILEEIRRSNDSPGARIGRRVFELTFVGTEAGRPIIGSEVSVRSFRRDDLYAFYRKWYQPVNMTIVAVGDFSAGSMLARVNETFGSLRSEPLPARRPLQVAGPKEHANWPNVSVVRGDFEQPRLEIVWPAPALDHFDAPALDLAAFALGSGEISRLSRQLRDREGIVTSIGASVYSPLFGGIFEVSALAGQENLEAATEGLAREVSRLRSSEPVGPEELARARASLKAERVFQEETVDGQARALGFGMRTAQKLLYDDVYTTLINTMPLSAVEAAVRRWLTPEAATVVLLVNEKEKVDEEIFRQAFRRGFAGTKGTGGLRQIGSKVHEVKVPAKVINLKPGLKLVYRHNPNVELFTLTLATEGGLRGETEETAGRANALSGLMGIASEKRNFSEFMALTEGMGASLEGFSGKDSLGYHLQCLTEHASTMLPLLNECLLTPVFPEEQWESLKREILQSLQTQNDSPSNICLRRFQEMLFGKHPYRFPLLGTAKSVVNFSVPSLMSAYKDVLASGPWVAAVASTLPLKEVVGLLEGAFKDFSPIATPRRFTTDALAPSGHPGQVHIAKDREQTHIVYGFSGLTWEDPDRAALDVLVSVLGGHSGRLFRELRDKDSLAYSVSPLIVYGRRPGLVGSYIACAPEKAERALSALKREMLALTENGPNEGEVERARAHIVGTHDMGLQKSDAQTSTMALMELYGYGYDDFLIYPKRILSVQPDDVRRVAKRLFEADKAVSVSVGPN